MKTKKSYIAIFCFFIVLIAACTCLLTAFLIFDKDNYQNISYYLVLVIISLIVLSIPYLIKACRKSNSGKYEDFALYFAGFVSPFLIAFFVILTGGPNNSLFTSLFFFIPSAVAIMFTARYGLPLICFTCGLAFIFTIIAEYNKEYFAQIVSLISVNLPGALNASYTDSTKYPYIYAFNTTINLIAIYFLEARSMKRHIVGDTNVN